MPRLTRADFLKLTALALGWPTAAVVGGAATAWAQTRTPRVAGLEPDLIVVNGKVYTMDAQTPRAQAFAVKFGRIIAVGSTADIRNLASARTQVIDAAGATITPGFIDAHCHVSGVNELYGVNTNLRTIKELQDALRTKAANTPPGQWVQGFMFDDTKLDDGPLHRKHLDAAVPNHPVSVAHRGGHTTWYNSKAFELAGVTKDTADPEHGRFFRDGVGEHDGRVAERAREVFGKVGTRESFTPEQQRERARSGMRHMSELLTATGLTSVHDASANEERLTAYLDAYNHGELRHRASLLMRPYTHLRDAGVYSGLGDEWVRIMGVKYAADGSASERTMAMSTPYVGTDDHGILTMTQDDIYEAVDEAHAKGWRVGIHANGDVAIDMVLKAYERALGKWPDPDRRHRIEHCSLVNPGLIARIKKIGAIPTPFWTYIYYHGEKWENYGDEKMQSMFAHRSLLDAGIVVPGASDYTPGPFEPLMAIQSMVTRTDFKGRTWGASQKLSVDDALKVATVNGAWASKEEHVKGSLTPGKFADFVVLEKDPHDVPPNTIKDIKVVRTVTGGRTVYPKTEKT
jgi:predicted amidohydrolase YtcJ